MPRDNDTQSEKKTRLSILSMSRQLYSSITSASSHFRTKIRPPTDPSPYNSLPFSLPNPQDITTDLVDVGCPQGAAQTMSTMYMARGTRLQAHWEANYHEGCKKLTSASSSNPDPPLALDHMKSVIRRHYQDILDQIFKDALERARTLAAQVRDHQESQVQSTLGPDSIPELTYRPTFNPEYVPILERYFERNAYPSIKHKRLLADHTKMTLGQINNWFQNHRSRARREGKALIRKPDIRVKFIVPNSDSYSSDSHPEASDSDSKPDDEESDGDNTPPPPPTPLWHTISQTSPSHAFPTTYPPLDGEYDPFPIKEGERNFSTPWYRTPAKPRPRKSFKKVSSSEVERLSKDIDSSFTVRSIDTPNKRRKRRWDVHLRIIPYPAPLPFLVPDKEAGKPIPTGDLPALKLKRAPPSLVKEVFKPQNAESPPTTLIPPGSTTSSTNPQVEGRWITRLSGTRTRTSARPRARTRACTPSTNSTLSSPPSTPARTSRRRQLDTDSSSPVSPSAHKRRRISLSSSSGSSSSLSSVITTPLLEPTRRPHNGRLPTPAASDQEFDFSSLDDAFDGLPVVQPLTESEGFQFGFQPPTINAKDTLSVDFFDFSAPAQAIVYVPS